jgi:8-hydroxy-5-deazaflavin:NADPH oxidoreductase
MKIAFIGAGNMALAMGRIFKQAGHDLFLSYSRDQDKLKKDAVSIDTNSGTVTEAVAYADIIVLTIPWQGAKEALEVAGDFKGKILWSIVNPFKSDYSGLAVGTDTSGSEELAKVAKNARFVAGWPLFAEVLNSGDFNFNSETATVFYCGDDAQSKTTVAELFGLLGGNTMDIGPLTSARLAEPAMFLLVNISYGQKMGPVAFKLLRRT